MVSIKCTDKAYDALNRIAGESPESYVDVGTKLAEVRDSGLTDEDPIGVLNHFYTVYVLESGAPGIRVLAVTDGRKADEIVVCDVGRLPSDTTEQKRHLILSVASALGEVPTDIHVIP